MKPKLAFFIIYPITVVFISYFLLFAAARLGGFNVSLLPGKQVLEILFIYISKLDSKLLNVALIIYSLIGIMVFALFIFKWFSFLFQKLIKLFVLILFITIACLCAYNLYKYYHLLKGALEFYSAVYTP